MSSRSTLGMSGAVALCLILGSGQQALVAQQAADQCAAVSIRCPLLDENGIGVGCPMPSDTGRFQRNRRSPVDQVVRNHTGVDYPAPNGTQLRAAADGMVEISRMNSSDGALGQHLIIRHTDGSATMYAHLSNRAVNVGDTVIAGQTVIGAIGSTGRSTGPHLHLEYTPSGAIYGNPNRINPHACIGRNVPGAISIRDNGSAADDAFQVLVDGREVGRTEIGKPNSIGINNLLAGMHTLTIVILTAPDGLGTYEVTLSNGWTFVGGGTQRTGSPPEGSRQSFEFTVPAPPR